MCYFINVAIHQDYDATLRARLEAEYSIVRTTNPSLIKMLPENSKAYVVIVGDCSCDLYSKPKDPEIELNKIRKKYRSTKFRKAGWTEAKLERAISDSIASLKPRKNGLRPSLRNALCDIAAQAKGLSLMVHWYSGGVETESIDILEKKKLRCTDILNDDWAVEEDKIIEIR